MTRDPYTRQIRLHTATAITSTAISCLMAAGCTALITDSDVTGAPAITSVLTLWLAELVWSGSYIRTAARRVVGLREQQALHRHRRMHRRSRETVEPLPGVDGLAVARDARVIEDHAHAAAMAAVADDVPLPERVGADAVEAVRPLPATVPMPTVDAAAVLPVQAPYAVRWEFEAGGARTVIGEQWGRRAA